MDKYAITIETYNKSAIKFQDKFMDMDLYNDTFDKFCNLIEKKSADVFEIACGPGNITKYLMTKRPDFKISGIDLSQNMINLAKINNPNVDFKLMDCRDINKMDKKYDAIMCGFCMPYLSREECAKLICDSSKLLNPNGLIYISTMEGDYNKSGFETTSFSGQDKVYIHYHQADFLTNELTQNGFKNIDIQRKDYPEPDGTFLTDLIIIAKKK
jgi:2-polyprenyl-3-methyl-5-hydroxy-6-metoxy-1,4-benzoquinol methylase